MIKRAIRREANINFYYHHTHSMLCQQPDDGGVLTSPERRGDDAKVEIDEI
jgi:hypothetical protein